MIRLFCRICRDKRIDYYTHEDAKMFREKALKLPPFTLRILQKHPEMSLSDLIGKGDATISVTTYNNYIKNLSTVFTHAKREGFATNHLFAYMKIRRKIKASSYRDVFSSDEVVLMFESTAKYRYTKRDFKYWLPRLAYYTGARLNELCQLYRDDVRYIHDVACIHIRAGRSDQRLKTPAAERVVPVHSKLVELGFLDYVESQGERIFPMFKHSEKHGYSATPSRWFGRFKIDIGLVDDGSGKKDFHSVRHSVANELKQKGVSENLIGGILGHTTGGMTNTRYGKDYKPEVLKPVIEMLTIEQTPQGTDMIQVDIERATGRS
ncbi:site-specific integrase [Franzmannia qiaohouensis]|uniref:Site-specific integrase n=1 Tax=Franzmannia qiaohouensis TaxID=1329370 RepID=A0ABU1HE50_9GAMM|nr:site-specific integrase [Halomonas qiaohouensis]MDR5904875.1 site-specific integrase [Halomonas qiaohouensis]